jgi:hypothetical protein
MSDAEVNSYCPYGMYDYEDGVIQNVPFLEDIVGKDPKKEWSTTFGYSAGDVPHVAEKLFTPVLMKGMIKRYDVDETDTGGSHLAKGDNPFAHVHSYCRGGDLVSALFIKLVDYQVNELLGDAELAHVCPSDWNLHLRPLPTYWNQLAQNHTDVDFEIEWEYYWGKWIFPTADDLFSTSYWAGAGPGPYGNSTVDPDFVGPDDFIPQIGDIVAANGRGIIDCGHKPWRSEIHPPNMVADFRGRWSPTFLSYTTRAQIWVNGFFNGDSETVTMWPPPRPTADAVMASWGPKDDETDPVTGITKSSASNGIYTKREHKMHGLKITFTADKPHWDNIDLAGTQFYPGDFSYQACSDGSGMTCALAVNSHAEPPLESKLHGYAALWKLWWVY